MQNNYYFRSKDIKVFPSSFRGNYTTTDGKTLVFDPESRLNTEANFIAPRFTTNHPSYIVDYDRVSAKMSYIKFVLGGYYFELYNVDPTYDYMGDLAGKSVGITLRKVALGDSDSIDSTRETLVLNSWIAKTAALNPEQATDYILDTEVATAEGEVFYFVGLKILEDNEAADHIITLLDSNGKINQAALLANIDHGTGKNTLLHGEGLNADYPDQTIFGKYNANKESSLFEVGNGSGEDEKSRSNALEISMGKTIINTPLEVTDTTSEALKISGGASVSENLNVSGNTDLGSKLIVKKAPDEDETNVKINGTLNVTGETSVDGTLNVAGETTICSNVTINSNETTLDKPVKITDTSDTALIVEGKTTLEKGLGVSGKITATEELEVGGDTTKILAVKSNPGEGEQNVIVTGTLKATKKATFENELEVTSGKTTTLGGPVKITGGSVEIAGKATSTSTDANDGDATLTTKDYVDNKITALDVTSVGEDGKYLKTISETDGIITATAQSFDTIINNDSTNTNAPTSRAVKTYINNIWTSENVTNGDDLWSLRDIILNAAYPIGSIYMMYSDKIVTECPIARELGGIWETITPGKFLVAASTSNDIYKFGSTGGFANAVVVQHSHMYDATYTNGVASISTNTNSAGNHEHDVTIEGHAAGRDEVLGFDPRRGDDVTGSITIKSSTTGSHIHKIGVNLPSIRATGQSGKNRNLPPYIAVYMWKRVAGSQNETSDASNGGTSGGTTSGGGFSGGSGITPILPDMK